MLSLENRPASMFSPSRARQNLPRAPFGLSGWPWTEKQERLPDRLPDGSPWPKISIVTPSYNQGRFLEETIRSVLLQDYPNLEYVIIDGGSKDNSVEIIKKYATWLDYWVSERDLGQSHAINKGWVRQSGALFGWLNSDDTLLPGALAGAALLMWGNPTCGLFYGLSRLIGEHGEVLRSRHGGDFCLLEALRSSKNILAQPSTFISRKALDKVGGLDESMEMSMDYDLWVRVGAYFPVVGSREVWSQERMWSGAKTSNIQYRAGPEHLRTVRKVFDKDVSRELRDIRSVAFAAAYARVARCYLQQGKGLKARFALAMGCWYHGPTALEMIKSAMGPMLLGRGAWSLGARIQKGIRMVDR